MIDIERTGTFFEIRWARESEWPQTMRMIWRTFLKYEGNDYTSEGIKNFFDFITDEGLYESFLKGEYQMMVALVSGEVIGAGTIRSRNHLSLLFVDERFHHMGVGSSILRQLCDYLKTEAGERRMSLQASPYAVDFYRKQGFRQVKPEMEYSGIRVTAMEKSF